MSSSSQRLTGAAFVKSLKGTQHEVYGKLLLSSTVGARSVDEWHASLDALRNQPVARDTPIRKRPLAKALNFVRRK